MEKIGIFYGTQSGSTEKIAKLIQSKLGAEHADLLLVKNIKVTDFDRYQNIILGCSTIGGETWDSGRPRPDWDVFRPEFEKIDCKGKTFALFGLGDNVSYPRHFVDNLGSIAKVLIAKGAKIVGQTSKDGYDFIESDAIIDGKFIGLPLNEDFESEMTLERVENWLNAIKPNLK